jgi:arsenate reductase (thioredoxin)
MRVRSLLVVALVATGASGCHAGEPAGATPPKPPETRARAGAIAAPLHEPLEASFKKWEHEGPTGDAEHKEQLRQLAVAIGRRLDETKQAELVFVCTHNSRRSHMAQLLGMAAARRSGLQSVRTFSGGTETTAFNARAVAALGRVGFEISSPDGGKNPHHLVRLGRGDPPVEAFSKRYDDPPNPSAGFIVVMTCSQADAACPFVRGAVARVAVPYEDPKVADGTPEETARYDERVAQIGRDLAWVFGAVANR